MMANMRVITSDGPESVLNRKTEPKLKKHWTNTWTKLTPNQFSIKVLFKNLLENVLQLLELQLGALRNLVSNLPKTPLFNWNYAQTFLKIKHTNILLSFYFLKTYLKKTWLLDIVKTI